MVKKFISLTTLVVMSLLMTTIVFAYESSNDHDMEQVCAYEMLLQAEQALHNARTGRSAVDDSWIEVYQNRIDFFSSAIEAGSPVYRTVWYNVHEYIPQDIQDVTPRGPTTNWWTRTWGWMAENGVLWEIELLHGIQEVVLTNVEATLYDTRGWRLDRVAVANRTLTTRSPMLSLRMQSSGFRHVWWESNKSMRENNVISPSRRVTNPFGVWVR